MTIILAIFELRVYSETNLLHTISKMLGNEQVFRANERLAAYVLLGYMCFCLFYAISTISYTRALGFSLVRRTNFLTFLSTALIFSDTCLPLYYNYLEVVLKTTNGPTQSVV